MKKLILAAALTAIALSGNALADSKPANLTALMASAKQSVAHDLKDPSSAQFRNVFVSKAVNSKGDTSYWVCGEVNAKNSFGAYAGFRKFVAARHKDNNGTAVSMGMDMSEIMYPSVCAEGEVLSSAKP